MNHKNPCRGMSDEVYADFLWHALQDKLKSDPVVTLRGQGKNMQFRPVLLFTKTSTREDIFKALQALKAKS